MAGNTTGEPATFLQAPLYPLLFAIFVPVNLLAQNITLFAPSQGIRAALVFLLAAIAVFLLINLTVRQKHGAALLTALLFAGIWIYQFSTAWRLVYVGLVLGALVAVWRGWNSVRFTAGLNLVMLAIILQPLYVIASEVWTGGSSSALSSDSPFSKIEPVAGDAPLPNIVHIVLDGYSNAATLSSVMGFDNSSFEAQLEELGFVVAGNARTPYNQTLLTMSSVYSGVYHALDKPPFTAADVNDIKLALGRVVASGPLKTSLADLGYSFLYTDPGFNFWQFGGSDIVSTPPLGPFTFSVYEQLLVERTSLNLAPRLFNRVLGRPNFIAVRLSEISRHALTTDFYTEQESPYLLYEHVVAPHPPFNIDRNGRDTDRWSDFGGMADGGHITRGIPDRQRRYIEGYLEKLRFVNDAILQQVQAMIRDIPSPKVIMIHGDHGGGAYYLPDDANGSCLGERFSPLLAIYTDAPEIEAAFSQIITARVNLVNLFRMIFDARFGTQMGIAPDHSWFASWDAPQQAVELRDEQIAAACILPTDS